MISEHRQAMRVTDQLVVSWRPVNNALLVNDNIHEIMSLSVNRELNNLISDLPEEASALRRVALLLNHKMDLIADTRAGSLYGPSLARVNISATGIAFDWHTAIPAGDQIRLTVTLPPTNERLTLTANVLDCASKPDAPHHSVRCRFVAAQEQKLTLINDYIEHRQRQARGSSSTDRAMRGYAHPMPADSQASLLHYR